MISVHDESNKVDRIIHSRQWHGQHVPIEGFTSGDGLAASEHESPRPGQRLTMLDVMHQVRASSDADGSREEEATLSCKLKSKMTPGATEATERVFLAGEPWVARRMVRSEM